MLLLSISLISDWIFPLFESREEGVVFRGSLSVGLSLINLALYLMFFALYTVLAHIQGSAFASSARRGAVFFPWLLVLLSVLLSFCAIYVLSKEVVLSDEKLVYRTLFEKKEVRWSDVASVSGNFVSGLRLGWKSSDYSWIDFTLRDGERVRISLRFMRGVSQIGEETIRRVQR